MLHFGCIVQMSPIVIQYSHISCFSQLERSECVDTHEGSEMHFAIGSTEYILMVNEVSPKEEEQSFCVGDHRVRFNFC